MNGTRKSELKKVQWALSGIEKFEPSKAAWQLAGQYSVESKLAGENFSSLDLIIAASTNDLSVPIWTFDKDFVRMSEKFKWIQLYQGT